jgi:hypothetical protein
MANKINGFLPSTRKNGKNGGNGEYEYITLDEVLASRDIVGVDPQGAIITADKGTYDPIKLNVPELDEHSQAVEPGRAVSAGQIQVGGETSFRRTRLTDYNPELSGKLAIEKYKEMKNDSIVRSTLRMPKTPVISARWFWEPASSEDIDLEVAEFVKDNFEKWMNVSFYELMMQILTMLDYGVSVFEKVYDVINWSYAKGPNAGRGAGGEQKVFLRKLAPIAVEQIEEFVYDDFGGPEAIKIETETGSEDLEIWKALIFTYDKENGDLWGNSVLRSAYKHWFYKENLYKIDAIQKERHGIGIPIIHLPPNFTSKGPSNDKQMAELIGQSLRTNERAHVVLPPNWEVAFLKLEGQRVDALESAEHHSEKLYENVMANFMQRSATSSETNVQQEVFIKSARFTAEIMRDVINKYVVPQLVAMNWAAEEISGYPELRVRRLGDERDWRTLSFAMRNFIGANVIIPDDELDAWVRDEMDMPMRDEATQRLVAAPQGATGGTPRPPHVGSPRQPTPDADRRSESGAEPSGPGNFGQDNSGG